METPVTESMVMTTAATPSAASLTNDGYDNITLNQTINVKPLDILQLSGSLRYVDAELQYDDFGEETDSRGIIIPNVPI